MLECNFSEISIHQSIHSFNQSINQSVDSSAILLLVIYSVKGGQVTKPTIVVKNNI